MPENKSQQLRLSALYPSPTNPRKFFDPVLLQELADSIKAQGVLQALLVRPGIKAGVEDGTAFEIVAGERRYRASKLAGLEDVPCDVRDLDDKQVAEIQVIENIQRDDLTPLEEARGYKLLIDKHGYDTKAVAEKIGKSPAYVYGCFKLLKLSAKWHKAMDEGNVTTAMAQVVAVRLVEHGEQDRVLKGLLDNWGPYSDCQTAEELRKELEERHDRNLKKAPWNLADGKLVEAAGACTACPYRSKAQTDLFGEPGKEDVCTKAECWAGKMKAHTQQLVDKAKAAGKTVLTGAAATKALADLKARKGALVDLDSSPGWYHRSGNLRDGLKGAKVPVTLCQDPAGRLRHLVDAKVAEKALPKESGPGYGGGGGSTGKMTPKEKLARRARLLDLKAMAAAKDGSFKKVVEKMVAKGLDLPALRNLLRILLDHHLDKDTTGGAAERMKIKSSAGQYGNAGSSLARWLDSNVSKDQVLTMAWQTALGRGLWDVNLTDPAKEVFKLAGVDWAKEKKVEADKITAARKAKLAAKEAKTPAKPKAKKKGA